MCDVKPAAQTPFQPQHTINAVRKFSNAKHTLAKQQNYKFHKMCLSSMCTRQNIATYVQCTYVPNLFEVILEYMYEHNMYYMFEA